MQNPKADYTVAEVCKLLGASKQAYYKHNDNAAVKRLAEEEFARQFITDIRKTAPGLGGVTIREIYSREMGWKHPIGRDRFCDIYESMGLKLKKKRRRIKTTDSNHDLPTYPNLVKAIIPERFGQVVVGDITYIPIEKDDGSHDFCYLNLLMDSYAKVVIGLKVAPTLEKEYSLMALQEAHAFLTTHCVDTHDTIHHTDRGGSVCEP